MPPELWVTFRHFLIPEFLFPQRILSGIHVEGEDLVHNSQVKGKTQTEYIKVFTEEDSLCVKFLGLFQGVIPVFLEVPEGKGFYGGTRQPRAIQGAAWVPQAQTLPMDSHSAAHPQFAPSVLPFPSHSSIPRTIPSPRHPEEPLPRRDQRERLPWQPPHPVIQLQVLTANRAQFMCKNRVIF